MPWSDVETMGPVLSATGAQLQRSFAVRSSILDQLVAEQLGLNTTDHKCLDLMQTAPRDLPMSPGRLAEMTGLSSGAITGVLDRLEKGRFIRRERDAADRRQVVIHFLPDRIPELEALFEPLARGSVEIWESLTPDEQAVIQNYFGRTFRMVDAHIARLRAPEHARANRNVSDTDWVVPHGDIAACKLGFPAGARGVNLADGDDHELIRAAFDGEQPKFEYKPGFATVRFTRSLLGRLVGRRDAGELRLSQSLAWEIDVRGGLSDARWDLSKLSLSGLSVRGGVDNLDLSLARASSPVPLEITGGARGLSITRPHGVGVRVHLRGGATKLRMDALSLDSVGGELKWESRELAGAASCFEIRIQGGVEGLSIASR